EEKTNDGKSFVTNLQTNLLPDKLNYDVELIPEKRYLGNYEIVLYRAKIKLSGVFKTEELNKSLSGRKIEESFTSFNLSDLRGMQKDSQLKWNESNYNLVAGLKSSNVLNNGFHSIVPIDEKNNLYSFEMYLLVKGLDNLEFLPIGKTTDVIVKSSWNNPSFAGAYLPTSRKVTEAGFTANWTVNYFNRAFPQQWNENAYQIFPSAFGVKLLVPVDEYQKTMRTSKYGLMIIVLTFLSFFMIELFGKKAIHPIQYLLIGLALIIFYSLLLAISEYLSFDLSYLISALLVILLISFYVISVYKSARIGSIIFTALTIFYALMYTILQLQDYSLLVGNIALFVLLASVMFFTRKINWFDVLNPKTN
ncbi:MAG: cell envelope integrity protein CreD, partial [Ignavibacteria bacterium]|nr:cell envelope integrity protein CreD [Ignavibacteria bacterium]